MTATLAGATATSQNICADRLLRKTVSLGEGTANRPDNQCHFGEETVPAFFETAQLLSEATNPHQTRQFRGYWFRRIRRQFESGEQGIRALGEGHSGEERCQTVPSRVSG
jgi:hypothetical protein